MATDAKRYAPPIRRMTSSAEMSGRLPPGPRGMDGQPIADLVAASTHNAW
jgi:hypothetical protein